jgi:hypothetical protein
MVLGERGLDSDLLDFWEVSKEKTNILIYETLLDSLVFPNLQMNLKIFPSDVP